MFVQVLVFPGEPGEGGLGAQDGEEDGERTVFGIVEPSRVDDEACGDGDGCQDEEEREGERGPARVPTDLTLGFSSCGLGHRSPQSVFLAVLPVEEAVSDFFSEPLPFEELEDSVLVVSFVSVFVALLL